ncbi:MAG TPA: sulfotransferase [Rhodanobacteraceae bacterium]|nr:sulfotransferase [Rhodanobacteraceae bacterium]
MTVQSPATDVATLLQKARGELGQRQFDAAAASLESALAMAPDDASVLGMAGVAAQMQGQHYRAVELFRKALAFKPRDAQLYAGIGISLFEWGDIAGAVVALRSACELAPNVAGAWFNLGRALKLQLHTDEAIAALQRALQLDPAHVSARITLADAKASIGQVDEAVAELRSVLKAHPGQAHAWFALANVKVAPFSGEDVELLQRNFERVAGSTKDRVLFGFALARALEDQGDHAASFKVLKRANRLQREQLHWDASAHHAHVKAIEKAFSAPLPDPLDPKLGKEVVFIASTPRSGSTLVEQILASHPEVEGANEIEDLPKLIDVESRRRHDAFPLWVPMMTAGDWHRLGAKYLDVTARWRLRKPRFTDKNLGNWMRAGTALAMLPAARVVVVRRDPVETCLACYRQWFSSGTVFAYDLDEMADYCIDFFRLTRFWLQRYPDRVFDLEYEALLADPEAVIRRLLDFCGLPFDPACLAFHQTQRTVNSAASAGQVRQPLQSATARAARYGHSLDRLRQRLHDAGLAVAQQ